MKNRPLRRALWACGVLLFSSVVPDRSAAAPLPVIDVMPAFLAAWNAGLGKPMFERVDILKARVLIPNRKAFADLSQLDDVHLAWYLADVEPSMPAITAISSTIDKNIDRYMNAFVGAFPGFHPVKPIYIQPSLLQFEGREEPDAVRFGIDSVAKMHGLDYDPGLLIAHELFHDYHRQITPADDALAGSALWVDVWKEGLATYVALQLNPGTTAAKALESAELAQLSAAKTQRLACLIGSRLETTSDDAAKPFLLTDASPPGLPAPGGYLIGFLVAQRFGTHATLDELARMHGEPLHADVRAEVARLCTTPLADGAATP